MFRRYRDVQEAVFCSINAAIARGVAHSSRSNSAGEVDAETVGQRQHQFDGLEGIEQVKVIQAQVGVLADLRRAGDLRNDFENGIKHT